MKFMTYRAFSEGFQAIGSSFKRLVLRRPRYNRAVARKKLQPRRTHGPLYEISRMKSSNIISLIKKIKIDSIW